MSVNESDFAVHLTTPKGKPFVLMPGDEIPEWAAKQITNPYVLGVDPDDEDVEDDSDGPPPRSGAGAGVRAWRKYAAAHDVDSDGLDVEGIIAALESAGVPVE
jgi:hypothetical protein